MSEQNSQPATSAARPELSRDMGLLHVTMIGVGAMIGAGIFVLTGLAAGKAGPALILVFALNGFVTLLTAFSYAELGSCFPEAGGGYLWVKEALPQPSGFLAGWMSWFAHTVACSLYAVAFGSFATDLLVRGGVDLPGLLAPLADAVGRSPHHLTAQLLAVIVTAAFAYINYRGAAETGKAETFVTVLKMIVIAVFIGFGLVAVFGKDGWTSHFSPFIPATNVDGASGAIGILVAMGLTFVAFEGYEIIAQCGEEVIAPKRNIPRAIFLSIAIVVPTYLLVAFVALGAIDVPGEIWRWLGTQSNPELAMVGAAESFIPYGAVLFLVGGIFSTMSALNATIYSSSRVSFAMGRDHNLPAAFGRVHPVRRTPHVAVWASAAVIAAMAVLLPIEDIASATDVMFLFLFILVNLAVINLRRYRPDLDRGFQVPWVPVVPIVAVCLNFLLIGVLFSQVPKGALVSGGYILVGIAIYYAYSRRRERERTGALTAYQEVSPSRREEGYGILVPAANPATVDELMTLATELARPKDGQLTVLHVVKVPPQLPIQEGKRFVAESKEVLGRALSYEARDPSVPVNVVSKISRGIVRTILEAAEDHHADLILLGWLGRPRTKDRVFGSILDKLIDNSRRDVVLVRRAPKPGEPIRRILVPFANPHAARLSFDVALRLRRWLAAPVHLLHITREDPEVVREVLVAALASARIPVDGHGVELIVVPGADPVETILAQATREDVLIMGTPQEGLLRRALFGDIPARVADAFPGPMLLTKPSTGRVKTWFQRLLGSRRILPE